MLKLPEFRGTVVSGLPSNTAEACSTLAGKAEQAQGCNQEEEQVADMKRFPSNNLRFAKQSL